MTQKIDFFEQKPKIINYLRNSGWTLLTYESSINDKIFTSNDLMFDIKIHDLSKFDGVPYYNRIEFYYHGSNFSKIHSGYCNVTESDLVLLIRKLKIEKIINNIC